MNQPAPHDGFAMQRHRFATRIEQALSTYLSPDRLPGPGTIPTTLLDAMRHGALNGGKRLRPVLVMQAAGIFGLEPERTMNAAMAVELVHCYSLIHDDLPAMDNDDLRRGLPTVHKAFDEATAILAGDTLLAHAFDLLASEKCHSDPAIRIALVAELAAGAGIRGMAGGQALDLEGEKGGFTERDIARMQAMKTGALIRAAVRMGAILGGANTQQLKALTLFGEEAGRAFQLADDILDVTASPEQMGKATGKDAARTKPTLVSRIGLAAARRNLGDTIHHALTALSMFGPEADGLRATARYFGERES
ncbi:MAG TPA: polyprenyl synthetase family protein [Devosia sp.]|nr:polyprenyl synthetase family protein [Devosia sp.]